MGPLKQDGKYILVGQTPVPCNDVLEWGRWFETNDRQVAATSIGPTRVSTVFLGLDHNWFGGRPLLFETMAFVDTLPPHENCNCFQCRNPVDALDIQERCSTWLEAEAQHARIVAQLIAEHPQDPVVDLMAILAITP